MLEVGALTTITPALVAAEDVDVVETDTRAGHHAELLRGGDRLGVDLGGGTHQDGVDVGDRGEEFRAVRAVAVPDLEIRTQSVDRGGRQLFSDEYDRLRAHVSPHKSSAGRPSRRPQAVEGLAAW